MLYVAQVPGVDVHIPEALQVLADTGAEGLRINRDGLELLHAEERKELIRQDTRVG